MEQRVECSEYVEYVGSDSVAQAFRLLKDRFVVRGCCSDLAEVSERTIRRRRVHEEFSGVMKRVDEKETLSVVEWADERR